MSLTAERLGRGADDLLCRDVAHVLSEPPAVTEGVCDLPMPVSPERIPERVQHLCARSDGPFPEGIHILNIKVQDGGCATHVLRREDAHLGELISHHHRRVAEPKFDAHELVAWQGYAASLLGAKSLCVPLGGVGCVPDDDMGSDGVHPFGDRLHSLLGHCGPPLRAGWDGAVLPWHGRMRDRSVYYENRIATWARREHGHSDSFRLVPKDRISEEMLQCNSLRRVVALPSYLVALMLPQNSTYLSLVPCSALPCVAPYCAPDGVRVVSAEGHKLLASPARVSLSSCKLVGSDGAIAQQVGVRAARRGDLSALAPPQPKEWRSDQRSGARPRSPLAPTARRSGRGGCARSGRSRTPMAAGAFRRRRSALSGD